MQGVLVCTLLRQPVQNVHFFLQASLHLCVHCIDRPQQRPESRDLWLGRVLGLSRDLGINEKVVFEGLFERVLEEQKALGKCLDT